MEVAAVSLFWILLVAVLAPLIARAIPRRILPEVVLLLALGAVIGPYGLSLASSSAPIEMLHELGLGMLFLLAGYEIDVAEVTGRAGRNAMTVWLLCFGLALVTVGVLMDLHESAHADIAFAIALTSTALGTLLPMLRDSEMLRTPVGAAVLRHGTFGELMPIIAIAVLLGTHGALRSTLVLAAFTVVVWVMARFVRRVSGEDSRLRLAVLEGTLTTAQLPVRVTMLMLVGLGAVAVAFDLDIVLAAFAAGFLLRYALPNGFDELEQRLEGIAFGFVIPIFFVTSGMAIDARVVAEHPALFVGIVTLIVLARGVPVMLASRFTDAPARFGTRESVAIGFFAATGLPIIVAVTAVAVEEGLMTADTASVLVAAGAVTVLVCPFVGRQLLTPRNRAVGSASRE